MARRLTLMLAGVALLSACGERPVEIAQPRSGAPTTPAPGNDGELLETNTTVLEDKSHGPMLCLGGILDSLPPQCGAVAIVGWDWSEVDGEEQMSGTTWGEFHVVGRYDGERFFVTEVGKYQPAAPEDPDEDVFASPCPEPEGGWTSPDPSRAGDSDRAEAMRAAQSEHDFAGAWVDQLEPFDPDSAEDGGPFVLNFAFTGDLERHESEIREIWGGPLCVSQHEHTMDQLHKIQNSDFDSAGFGLQTLTSSINVMENVVEFEVVAVGEETLSAVEDRFGDAVEITPALTPID